MREHADYFTQTSVEAISEEDEEILDWLNRALAADPRTTDALIMAEVHGGEVVLRGDVTVPGIKAAAEDVAWGIPGVHSVVNQIVAHGAASDE
ncbi:MAG: BON domain-containing protein [Sphingomonadaceae bacterium]